MTTKMKKLYVNAKEIERKKVKWEKKNSGKKFIGKNNDETSEKEIIRAQMWHKRKLLHETILREINLLEWCHTTILFFLAQFTDMNTTKLPADTENQAKNLRKIFFTGGYYKIICNYLGYYKSIQPRQNASYTFMPFIWMTVLENGRFLLSFDSEEVMKAI